MTDKKAEDHSKGIGAPSAEPPAPKKSGLMMYIMMGVGGIALAIAIVVGVLMFTKEKTADSSDTAHSTDSTAVEVATLDSKLQEKLPFKKKAIEAENTPGVELSDEELAALDSSFAPDSQSVIKDVVSSLEFLDYKPADFEIASEDALPLSASDSLEAVDWFTKEETRLSKKEAELAQREQQIAKLDASVSKKIIRVEQAETARIGTLAKMYDGMDPKAVAKLMADLDDETIVSILPRMKTNNASSVMGLLPPPRAAKLSKQMITIADGDTK
jgi:flagellar motility protein MotE (MotC chaperone)